MCWEQWGRIRQGGRDVDLLNRLAISLVFIALAGGAMAAGYARLHIGTDIGEYWATTGLAVSASVGLLSMAWLVYLTRFAYSYRRKYRYTVCPTCDGRAATQDSRRDPDRSVTGRGRRRHPRDRGRTAPPLSPRAR